MCSDVEHSIPNVPIQQNTRAAPVSTNNSVTQNMDSVAADNHSTPVASTNSVATLTKTTQPASAIPNTYANPTPADPNATQTPETANPTPSITTPTVAASSSLATASAATITTVTHNNGKAKKRGSKKKAKKSAAQRVVEAQELAENSEEENESRGRGRIPWATGIIEQFLLGFMPQYQSEIVGDQKRAPTFYNEVVRSLFTIHGWGVLFPMLVERGVNLEPARPVSSTPANASNASNTTSDESADLDLDLPPNPYLPTSTTDVQTSASSPIAAPEPLTTAFIRTLNKRDLNQLKSQYYLGPGSDWTKEIWKIGRTKVAAWFPYRCARLTNADTTNANLAVLAQHFASLTGLYVEKPRMPQPIQEYTRRFWPTQISAIFDAEWKAKCEKLRAEGKEVPTKIGVQDRNTVVRHLWQQESKEFQDAIKADLEKAHKVKLADYKEKMKNIPEIGKQYNWTRQQAFGLLQPLTTALSMRFGAVVSIMIAAPLRENGEVETIHVTSGQTREAAPRKWDRYDSSGVDTAEAAFTKFADQCFSIQDRQTRRTAMAASGPDIESEDEERADERSTPEELDAGAKQEMQLIDDMGLDHVFDAPVHVATSAQVADSTLQQQPHAAALFPSTSFVRPTLPHFIEALKSINLNRSDVVESGGELGEGGGPAIRNRAEALAATVLDLDGSSVPSPPEPVQSTLHPSVTAAKHNLSTTSSPAPAGTSPPPEPTIPKPRPRPIPVKKPAVTHLLTTTEATTSVAGITPDTIPPPSILGPDLTSTSRIITPDTVPSPFVDPPKTIASISDEPTPDTSTSTPDASFVTPKAASSAPVDAPGPSRATASPPIQHPPTSIQSPLPIRSPSPPIQSSPPPIQPSPSLIPPSSPSAQTSTLSTPTSRPVLSFSGIKDPDLHKWYEKAFNYLYDAGLGDWFMSMVNRFYAHEEAMEFYSGPEGLDKGSRPDELTEWIACARPWTDRQPKKIRDLETFASRFKEWWCEVQPEGRVKDSLGRFIQHDEPEVDWNEIRLSGKNGLFTVVAGLCFWGQALGSDEGRLFCEDWFNCVSDVSWVLNELVRTSSLAPASGPISQNCSTAKAKVKAKVKAKGKAKTRVAEDDLRDDGSVSRSAKRRRVEKVDGNEGGSVTTRSANRANR